MSFQFEATAVWAGKWIGFLDGTFKIGRDIGWNAQGLLS